MLRILGGREAACKAVAFGQGRFDSYSQHYQKFFINRERGRVTWEKP